MKQVRKAKQETKVSETEVEAPAKQERPDLGITDDLLDEIDELLEENAEEFVKAYVQKGGE